MGETTTGNSQNAQSVPADSSGLNFEAQLQATNELLYKHSLELVVKNKTLSLLHKFYQTSLRTLEPASLAEYIVSTIRETFELELVGILLVSPNGKTLVPLKFNISQRLTETELQLDTLLEKATIQKEGNTFLDLLFEKQPNHSNDIFALWKGSVPDEVLTKVAEKAHIKTVASYPLIANDTLMGTLVVCFNRPFNDVSASEIESISSIVDLTALAFDRVRLYEELKIANERLKGLDQLKSEFLSIASHQLRAPITAVRGYAANIMEGVYGKVPTHLEEPLETIQESSRLMANSVEDYLNISRIDQGRMKYEKSDFEVYDLVKKVVGELAPVAAKKGLTLSGNRAEGSTLTVKGDVGKIRQVITNLIDNAIKYTEKGSITVSVSAANKRARIEIADTGVGMNPADIPGLFAKFKRARDANRVNTTGTGLGLYVAKQLVEGHGGTVAAYSEGKGKGSKFVIELPI